MEKEELTHKNSLALKCFRIIFAIYFGFNLIITGLQIGADFFSAREDVINDIDQYQSLLSGGLADALYKEDEDQVKTLALGIMGSKLISGVKVTTDDDEGFRQPPRGNGHNPGRYV